MTDQHNIISKLSTHYSNRPVIKALLNLVPFWGSADTLLQKRAEEIKNQRLTIFFDELAQGKCELTDELIKSDSFLHAYFCTLKASMNSRQDEKIRNFARLLNSSLDPIHQMGEDEHEELIILLEEISLREFAILCDLKNYELQNPRNKDENDLQHAWRYWGQFKKSTFDTYGLPEESFDSFMARLERTGLYLRLIGAFLDYRGNIGFTTPLFSRLMKLISKA